MAQKMAKLLIVNDFFRKHGGDNEADRGGIDVVDTVYRVWYRSVLVQISTYRSVQEGIMTGGELTAWIEKNGSRHKINKELGISRSTLHSYENGRTTIPKALTILLIFIEEMGWDAIKNLEKKTVTQPLKISGSTKVDLKKIVNASGRQNDGGAVAGNEDIDDKPVVQKGPRLKSLKSPQDVGGIIQYDPKFLER